MAKYVEVEGSSSLSKIIYTPDTIILITPKKKSQQKKPKHRIYDITDEFGMTMCFVVFLSLLFLIGVCFGIIWQGLLIYPF